MTGQTDGRAAQRSRARAAGGRGGATGRRARTTEDKAKRGEEAEHAVAELGHAVVSRRRPELVAAHDRCELPRTGATASERTSQQSRT